MANNTPSPQNSSEDSRNLARIEKLLLHGQLANTHGVMRWGSNYAVLVNVNNQIAAVYKPQRGERPLWDFPDGTLCYREVVAYLVSQALEWELVPPTVLREGFHGLGSLQLFIEHNPEVNYFSLNDAFVPQLQRYAIFDFLINNADRKGGHILLDADGKLWGIDHGLSFHTMPKLRTVIWDFEGQRISDPLLDAVQQFADTLESTGSELRCRIEPLLSAAEINALLRRSKQILDCKIYPKPGPGPNYPWPPV